MHTVELDSISEARRLSDTCACATGTEQSDARQDEVALVALAHGIGLRCSRFRVPTFQGFKIGVCQQIDVNRIGLLQHMSVRQVDEAAK